MTEEQIEQTQVEEGGDDLAALTAERDEAVDRWKRAVADLESHFATLQSALAVRVAAKRAYIAERGAEPAFALEPRCLDMVADSDREAFFRRANGMQSQPAPMPAVSYSLKLR